MEERRTTTVWEEQARRQHRPLQAADLPALDEWEDPPELRLERFDGQKFSRPEKTAAAWQQSFSVDPQIGTAIKVVRVVPLADLAAFSRGELTRQDRLTPDTVFARLAVDLESISRLGEVVVSVVTETRVAELPLATLLATLAGSAERITPEHPLRDSRFLNRIQEFAAEWQGYRSYGADERELTKLANDARARARDLGFPKSFRRVLQYHLDPIESKGPRSLPPRTPEEPVSLDARRQRPREHTPLTKAREELRRVAFSAGPRDTEPLWHEIFGLAKSHRLWRGSLAGLAAQLEDQRSEPGRSPLTHRAGTGLPRSASTPIGFTIVMLERAGAPGEREVVELPLADLLMLLHVPYYPGEQAHRPPALGPGQTSKLPEQLREFDQLFRSSAFDRASRQAVDEALVQYRSLSYTIRPVPHNPLYDAGELGKITDLLP